METNLQDISWQKEFIEINSHNSETIRLLLGEARGWWDLWTIGDLHA